MQPEISRRCLVCGAAPRAGAHFCPQCGNNLTGRGSGAEGAGVEVRPEASAGRDDGAGVDVANEAAREVADVDEVEVARAFEAWRSGEAAVPNDEARNARAATAEEEEARVVGASEASNASTAEGAGESSGAHGALMSEPSVAGAVETQETPGARGGLMGEPLAGRPSPVAEEVEEKDAAASSSSASSSSSLASPSTSKAAGAVGATRRRAAAVVKESIAPRVERVRDRSIVMLEESQGDSGLRFVLVAALMFALFVFMVVLSTFIK